MGLERAQVVEVLRRRRKPSTPRQLAAVMNVPDREQELADVLLALVNDGLASCTTTPPGAATSRYSLL
jgi:hypothetical protein